MTATEFGQTRLKLPREERQEIVASLRDSGLSVRAIASATGMGYGTVRRELDPTGEPNGSPQIQGTDGKTYFVTREPEVIDRDSVPLTAARGTHPARTPTDDRRRVALHEAGHSYVAWRLGCAVGPVTAEPGARWAGMAHFDAPRPAAAELDTVDLDAPYLAWPAVVRHSIDTDALVAAAGDVAEDALWRGVARRPGAPLAERAAELAVVAPLSDTEQRRIRAGRDTTTGKTDAERLAELLALTHPDDHAAGAAWLAYITAAARTILTAQPAAVLRLAGQLAVDGTLSGAAVEAILRAAP